MLAVVFLADLIVFVDLARAELSSLQTEHRALRRAGAGAALGRDRAHGAAERQPS